jgi:hypothetical protein
MKLYYFSEMPHHEFPDEEGDKYPSLRLEFPNRFFDREKAAANYQRYRPSTSSPTRSGSTAS